MTTKFEVQIVTENKPGVLYRIAGVFLRWKINVEELEVHATKKQELSEFKITLFSDTKVMSSISRQLNKIIEVRKVLVKHY